jgi:hypothetical protein
MSGHWRFQRRVRAGGVQLNFNKGSMSVTTGTRGAHVTYNPTTGAAGASVGLPGSGLSYRWYLPPPTRRSHAKRLRYRWPRMWLVWQLFLLTVVLACAVGELLLKMEVL